MKIKRLPLEFMQGETQGKILHAYSKAEVAEIVKKWLSIFDRKH